MAFTLTASEYVGYPWGLMSFLGLDQQKAILDLSLRKIDEAELLLRFPLDPVRRSTIVHEILTAALDSRSASDAELGMLLGFCLGFSADHAEVLTRLLDADWHRRHEDVVSALDKLRYAGAADALRRVALKEYPYLAYDEAFALGVKAVWALAKLATPDAIAALKSLARCENRIVRRNARQRLHRLAMKKEA